MNIRTYRITPGIQELENAIEEPRFWRQYMKKTKQTIDPTRRTPSTRSLSAISEFLQGEHQQFMNPMNL